MKKGLKIEPRATDYVLGSSSPITFTAANPIGDWTSHIFFYEPQKLQFETDGCVLFTFQESFDAQMDLIYPTLSLDIQSKIIEMGFMDTGTDGNLHFHSSPRFLEILTGNGTNGNNLYDAPDVARKYGVLPWKDLPFDSTLTEAQYFAPLPQMLMDKALKFRNLLGGKEFVKYHWIINGGKKNLPLMNTALQQAPLCLGISVGPNWNQIVPADPIPGSPPEHSVMLYKEEGQNAFIYDHYQPANKTLDAGFEIPYALQSIVKPIILPPLPAPLPNPATNAQISQQISKWQAWINILLNIFSYKGIPDTKVDPNISALMNYSIFKSRAFWTLVATFVYNVWQLAAPSVPPQYSALIDFVFTSAAAYFHFNPSQNYNPPKA